MTTAVLSKKINVSQGSIINFSNSLGFNGFSELKLNVAQNIPNREQVISESLCKEDLPHTVLKKLSEEILQTFQMTISALQNSELEHAANIIMQKTHIEIYGVGSSSMIANDAYYRYMRQGFPVIAVTDPHIASVSASLLDENSAIIIISYSGRSMEIVKTAEIAKKKGAAIISVTSFSDSPLAKLSDVCLVSASKEADKNKEAIAARHSQLLILDSLLAILVAQKYR